MEERHLPMVEEKVQQASGLADTRANRRMLQAKIRKAKKKIKNVQRLEQSLEHSLKRMRADGSTF